MKPEYEREPRDYAADIASHPGIEGVVDLASYKNFIAKTYPDKQMATLFQLRVNEIMIARSLSLQDSVRSFFNENPDALARFAVTPDFTLMVQDNRFNFFNIRPEEDEIGGFDDLFYDRESQTQIRYDTDAFESNQWFVLNGLWLGYHLPEHNGFRDAHFCEESDLMSGPMQFMPQEINLLLAQFIDDQYLPFETACLFEVLKEKVSLMDCDDPAVFMENANLSEQWAADREAKELASGMYDSHPHVTYD